MRRLIPLLALAMILAACSKGTEPDLTTTTRVAPPTTTVTTVASTTTAAQPSASTSTTSGSLPGYTVVAGSAGGILVVLLDPGNYSDIDIRNVVDDAIERFTPVELHVVDSREAADLVLVENPTEDQQKILDEHQFARVIGDQLEFLGPYASSGSVSIGS
ncbi:hypothetical protein BMS3Abin02_02386 [bacterium BMS3Abin02]|nr:hypothetical protein BMS3Abin02_02386 [bacterium BMS3Abin02]HDL48639.1 hypothetical protein [Actinomycetota bacterium]